MKDYASRAYLNHQKISHGRRRPSWAFDVAVLLGWYLLRKVESRRPISTAEWLKRMRDLDFGLK